MENEHTIEQTKAFIVEDSASIRERLTGLLREIEGVCVVGEADSPGTAVEGILRTRPDVVVLDIQLIGGTGVDVLRAVHPKAPEVMFIVLTNYPNPQYRAACVNAGASFFLDKNTEIGRVTELIGNLRHPLPHPKTNQVAAFQ